VRVLENPQPYRYSLDCQSTARCALPPANATATEQSTKQLPRPAACAALPSEYAQCRLLAHSGKANFAASGDAFYSLVVCVFSQLANDQLRDGFHPHARLHGGRDAWDAA
jgi:hypothetical protein